MTKLRFSGRLAAGVAAVCALALLSGTGLPGTALAASAHAPARRLAACTSGQTEIWLGLGLGGGTAGTIFYPLEFTNIGRRSCVLGGYPVAAAVTQDGHQIGPSSRRLRSRHGLVRLRPGWTAHALLGIIEAGNVCSSPVTAVGLLVRAPGQRGSTNLPFSFEACRSGRVLVVGPIRPGVGIP
jgi:hypothetical protein